MNRLGIIGIVALLIAALVFLNHGMSRNAPPEPGEDDPPPQSQTHSAPKLPETPTANTLTSTALPPEETVGDPSHAKHHIQVGWAYDAENQPNSAALAQRLSAIRQYVQNSHGTVSAEIVNVDVPVADRSPAAQAVEEPGVSVDGKIAIAGNPSSAMVSQAQFEASLKRQAP